MSRTFDVRGPPSGWQEAPAYGKGKALNSHKYVQLSLTREGGSRDDVL
jgi:hypothetical protein